METDKLRSKNLGPIKRRAAPQGSFIKYKRIYPESKQVSKNRSRRQEFCLDVRRKPELFIRRFSPAEIESGPKLNCLTAEGVLLDKKQGFSSTICNGTGNLKRSLFLFLSKIHSSIEKRNR